MIEIRLPDGSTLEVEEGTTVEEVAYEIGEGLGDDTVAGKLDGELVAKEQEIHNDGDLEIITEDHEEYIKVLRHSASHVFAQALKRLHPEAKLAIGPWTEDGFYYDVAGVELEEEDLEEIEEEMEDIVEEDLEIEREEVPRDEAEQFYEDNRFKQEVLEEEAEEGEKVSFYVQGDFRDLCKGPHVESTGDLEASKLLQIAGAYWRGEEDNQQLTRVYGTAFESGEELEEFMDQRRKAEERDHRRIGEEMDIFSINSTAGPGLPLYHPNGKKVLNELRDFIQDLNRDRGCEPVETPHLFKTELWKESGHYENYQDDMFLFEVQDEEFGLKPMNCPGHCLIYNHEAWSYRDLPVRYTEQGKVYRKEQRGELSGLSRVWSFTIDDGHLFVRPDQIDEEVEEIMENIFQVLETFGLDHQVMLATKPEDKYAGSDEIWDKAESQLENVLERMGIDYELEEGEGAFYGPKIDFAFEDALGREWDGPTVQLDFNMPDRFGLTYTGKDNEEKQPVMIHRALYGSYERFLMVLLEHFNGNFPTWLAPEQVRILPVSDENLDYAEKVKEELGGFRVEIEDRSWTVGKKIQAAHDDNVPYMLIVGDDEEENGTVAVRDRGENEEKGWEMEQFRQDLEEEVDERRIEPRILS
ncbi:MAG: threonine--tRNA ligase [Candidatus Nanohaloarchaeota archaeon QJJ-7]|nr:threonine--tRNA ligase [Candidatus Nanohaloarchaeota archaeon QJJ-7]